MTNDETPTRRSPKEDHHVFHDDSMDTQAVMTIAPEHARLPGAIGISLSEIAGNRDTEFDKCTFSIPAEMVGEVIDAMRTAAARYGDAPDLHLSDQERLTAAISMLAFASEVDGGIHSFEVAHDGDGWTEPFSDHYWCGCQPDDGNAVWSVDWMQPDPEHTGRPDPTAMLIFWAEHVQTACDAPAGHPF